MRSSVQGWFQFKIKVGEREGERENSRYQDNNCSILLDTAKRSF